MTTSPAFRELPRFLLAILFILLLLSVSLWILRPFLSALVWATLIVVSTWQLMLAVQRRLWGKRSLAVLLMTGAMLLIVILPLGAGGVALADHAEDAGGKLRDLVQAGVPAPPAWVAKLPLVGPKVAARWQEVAALDPEQLQVRAGPHLKSAAAWVIGTAGGLAGFLLHLLLTLILAALLYSNGEVAAAGVRAFAIRLAGQNGEQSVALAGASIRAVALGVIVTALTQSLLGGIGLVVAGVPFAGMLTLAMFVLGIAQIGAAPVLLLALAWLFWSGNTLAGSLFIPWALFVTVMDNFLKPILIKRGADLPLVLIFAGVIGGLVAFGVVGLFIGPVVLAVTYTQLVAWVNDRGAVTVP
ncbi:AI-2E family transporter YdiK [Ramlibacter sp. PS3R-8]|uniref:AI-2E family transporter YdiK n=1 Tax=Ramlibacter sp. PS3R-8 TaxID=3133437 RepID=UPI00309BB076